MSEQQFSGFRWRTSSYSTGQGTECVQVGSRPGANLVAARDSKDPSGPVLSLNAGEWADLVRSVKNGALDR
ncbi:DUF397 domain-containing protein [Actinomadura gamaensis]|uniref:DUF397 domain-containing protein n=1 Tax=Actinomadura gamaensis TaxID=1763541 RepID=A0ABV9U1F7_9ACTN